MCRSALELRSMRIHDLRVSHDVAYEFALARVWHPKPYTCLLKALHWRCSRNPHDLGYVRFQGVSLQAFLEVLSIQDRVSKAMFLFFAFIACLTSADRLCHIEREGSLLSSNLLCQLMHMYLKRHFGGKCKNVCVCVFVFD